jgi:flavin-dependent dehydrogenase
VLVLDREHFPRDKPCGEFINPAAVQALARLGVLGTVKAQQPVAIRGWALHPYRAPSFRASFAPGIGGIGLPRRVLDALLLDHARERGAEVRTGVQVLDVVRAGGDRITGARARDSAGREHEIAARLVVGADGLRSVIVRRLGLLRRTPRLRKIALTSHLRTSRDLGGYGRFLMHGNMYIGVAEVGAGLLGVAVVASREEMQHVAGRPDEYFDCALAREPLFTDAERVEAVMATGPFDWPTRCAVADGALLVGDAAGYYDPFTGQGIYRALRGAELAVEALDRALRGGDVSAAALLPYDRAQRRAFTPGVRVQYLIEAFLSRPRAMGMASRLLAARPALADALLAVTGDISPVRSLLGPRMLCLRCSGAEAREPGGARPAEGSICPSREASRTSPVALAALRRSGSLALYPRRVQRPFTVPNTSAALMPPKPKEFEIA